MTNKKRTFTDIQAIKAGVNCAAKHLNKNERVSKVVFLESGGYCDRNTSVLMAVYTYDQETGTKEREIWVNVWINQKPDHSAKINAELHDTLY